MSGGGALDLSHSTVYLVVFTTTVKVSVSLLMSSKLVRPHHMIDTSTLPSQWPCVCQTHLHGPYFR